MKFIQKSIIIATMITLAIETSCDETSIAIIEHSPTKTNPSNVTIKSHLVFSQAKLHAEFGGVFPTLAKREHSLNIVPLLKKSLEESGLLLKEVNQPHHAFNTESLTLLEDISAKQEPEMAEQLKTFLTTYKKPVIDKIAVTAGPGLEPALWVGINLAKVLSVAWGIPLVPVNHMLGHLASALFKYKDNEPHSLVSIDYQYPIIALLISGGHTEIILSKEPNKYEKVGQTKDDAIGEAFDKVARLLGLPYPGGPQISQLATIGQANPKVKLPRPMLASKNFDFSFSGLKTAVLYLVKELGGSENLDQQTKADIAKEFEEACTEVITKKTLSAITFYQAKALAVGGGVSANRAIMNSLKQALGDLGNPVVDFLPPAKGLSTDNALMIALASLITDNQPEDITNIKANGNWSLIDQ